MGRPNKTPLTDPQAQVLAQYARRRRDAADRLQRTEQLLAYEIHDRRIAGASWDSIATACGMSNGGVWAIARRYTPPPEGDAA